MTERRPTTDTLKVIAADLGIIVDDSQLEAAARRYASFRGKLEEFRGFRLPFLAAIEPGHVRQWIERRGRSRDGQHEHGPAS